MNINAIVQFECFETSVPLDEFVSSWKYYARRFVGKNADVTLQQCGTKNRFKYVSQHESAEDNFRFAFMKGRYSPNFPECNVRVVQAGGYTISQRECMHDNDPDDVKIMVFIKHEKEMLSYQQAPSYRYLNIYQSYFESCLFAGVLEFYVEKIHANDFIKWIHSFLKDTEGGIYNECLVLHE